MRPEEWTQGWQHPLIALVGDKGLLPVAAQEFLLSYGMPTVVIFESHHGFGNEISFSPLTEELSVYNSRVSWGAFYDEALDLEWSNQVVIAEEDFCNGAASYCIQKASGEVFRIDCELPNPQSFVNSTIVQFGMSLLAAKEWSEKLRTAGLEASGESVDLLARKLASVDIRAFTESDSFWPGFVKLISEEKIEITNDPARSKSRF